jgi:glutathione S-transferase
VSGGGRATRRRSADLERLAPSSGLLFGAASIADISVAVFYGNLAWARVELALDRWPGTLAWVERMGKVPGPRSPDR